MRRQRRLDKGLPIVVLLALIFALTFGLMSLQRLLSFSMAGYDLTNMSQAMWNTAHGRPFVFTFAYPITHRLGVHIEPIFLLIAPLYRIFPRPETSLVLQAVIVASGALPAYWLAQARLHGALPTYAWTSGEVVPDHHLISLDESISAGEYTLIASMYDGLTVERLPLLKFSGSAQNNAVVIGKISVR
jgi:uncharacterized membrane protein